MGPALKLENGPVALPPPLRVDQVTMVTAVLSVALPRSTMLAAVVA
jgi:hypothetical protein